MNIVLKNDGEEIGKGYRWLLCCCSVCEHDDIRLCRFTPVYPEHHIYFAICSNCKNSTDDCKTVYEAVKKWSETYECT